MKKTFKKQLTILCVVTVMLVASVFCISAAEACPDGTHPKDEIIAVVVPATCTQDGYTYDFCKRCESTVTEPYNYVAATNHSYEVSYVADGDSYDRVLTCTNELCARAEQEGESNIVNSQVTDAATYYSVEFINEYESPAIPSKSDYESDTAYLAAVENHKSYFDPDHYVVSQPATWLSTSYLTKEYAPEIKATADGTKTSPDLEYINAADGIRLFVKDGQKAVYSAQANIPARNKDKAAGYYTFSHWLAGAKTTDDAISANTVFRAQFTATPADEARVSYAFYGAYNTTLTTGTGVDYGKSVVYDLPVPVKTNDVANTYTFDGWRLGASNLIYKDVQAEIPLYYNASINAQFKATTNGYDYKFVNYKGEELGNEYVLYREGLRTFQYTNKQLERPKDEKYLYAYAGKWLISAVDGYSVIDGAEYSMSTTSMTPPASVAVVKDGKRVDITLDGTQDITLTPAYNKSAVRYYIPIYVTPVHFEPEDRFEDDSFVRSDLLDDFHIQVQDANGQMIAAGRTVLSEGGKSGYYLLNCIYTDSLLITAYSDDGKYLGEYSLNLKYVYDTIEETGIAIAPSLSPEWEAGNTHSCSCICHSFLGSIVVRIYNILYRFFNIKYVCCPDLFAAHGNILAYTKDMV